MKKRARPLFPDNDLLAWIVSKCKRENTMKLCFTTFVRYNLYSIPKRTENFPLSDTEPIKFMFFGGNLLIFLPEH